MVIITGASGGLGGWLARELEHDHEVVGTYNCHLPDNCTFESHRVNVTDSASVAGFVKVLNGRAKAITLINMAGISEDAVGHRMTEDAWDRVLETNLKGTFLMCRAFLPLMREQGWGRIVNVSSVVGQLGVAGTGAYAASKAGVIGLTRTLAVENAAKRVTVNALALGYFAAGMLTALPAETQEAVKSRIPMKSFGNPTNIAAAVRFLMESDYTTGAVLNINGGLA